ncbi:MAG: hypothetical protein ABIT05_16990 [Chitinophagaceae bacterium]
MKRLFFSLQFPLFIAFNFFLLMTVFQVLSSPDSMSRLHYNDPKYNAIEEFDPSLERLNTIDRLVTYIDSVYAEKAYTDASIKYEQNYPEIATAVIRKRFYHGYSLYGFSNNFMAMFASQLVQTDGLSAIVIPKDILRYPFAACSQQSIVLMTLLQSKGFNTRKVGFLGKNGGHFCFEVYYNGTWHFYDPDMEPKVSVLEAYNYPGIDFLAKHKDIVLSAYPHYPKEKVLDIFSNYFYGKVNASAAPNALIFQKITQFLSYTTWLFFLVSFIFVRRKYLRLSRQTHVRNSRIRFPQLQRGASPEFNLEYQA